MPLLIVIYFALGIWGYAQFYHTFVTTTQSFDATAFNNSHKIAARNEAWDAETLCIVFQDSDNIIYIHSTNRGLSWEVPVVLSAGCNPGIDIDIHNFRHIVWQQPDTTTGIYDVYYDCLDDWATPRNISESNNNSILADVVVDDSLTAHIVWVEDIGNNAQIYYRACYAGSLGTISQISPTWPDATHTLPSISIHAPDNQVYVVWDALDYSSYSPYMILSRYKQGAVWYPVDWIHVSYLPVEHSSIDFDHANELFSCCFDYETAAGNNEVTFVNGNGGGYNTPGTSTYPVLTTIGDVWSYLFWQEDSAGVEDIYFHLYYFVTGWTRGSIRSVFNLNDPVRFPSSCGAYLTWTQGESAPYDVYFADFGYPVGSEQSIAKNPVLECLASPNPFREETRIAYSVERIAENIEIHIYDIAGNIIKSFSRITPDALRATLSWDGTDNQGQPVPAGTYFIVLDTYVGGYVQKIVKLK